MGHARRAAGIYKNDGRYDDAIKAYEAAITEKSMGGARRHPRPRAAQERS
ncbi:MAG: hypothetical protein R3F14_19160 [Polyangiaceae bacterium]